MSNQERLIDVISDLAHLAHEAGNTAFNNGDADMKARWAAVEAMAMGVLHQQGEGA